MHRYYVVLMYLNSAPNGLFRESRPADFSIHMTSVMDVEKTITEIELLERIYTLPDKRPLQVADREAANQKHDATLATNPWFRLWKRYGV